MEFSEWITRKYVEWRGDKVGNDGSIVNFAAQFNASQQIVSGWMKKNGYVPKSKKYVDALVKKYGSEVYDVLGLDRPAVPSYVEAFLRLPLANQQSFSKAVNEALDTITSRGIDASSPEAETIFKQSFKKYNFDVPT